MLVNRTEKEFPNGIKVTLPINRSQSSTIISLTPEKLYAWYGHALQERWLKVKEGSLLFLVVEPDSMEKPSPDLEVKEYILNEGQIFYLPPGIAFGYKSFEDKAQLQLFSSFNAKDSLEDAYRFDRNLWYYETFMF